MISVVSLSKNFEKTAAVQSVSLDFEPFGLTALLGESGCGKTTLLRLIAGLEKADSGKILLNGLDITSFPPQKRGIGMVFQDFALFPHLNVEANIAFGLKKKDKDKVFEMLKKVKLEGLERRYPHELSGGQQQRVALARSLAVEPKVLLLDEPFSNLDPSLKQDMTWELKEWLKSLTVLMVTHDAKDALAVADKLVLMRKGSVVQYGRPYDLYRNPVNLYCASYFGTINVFDAQQLFDFFRLEFQQGLYMVRAEDFHAELVESGCLLLSQIYQGGKWLACMDLEGKKIFSYLPKEYEVNRSFFRLIPKNITALKP